MISDSFVRGHSQLHRIDPGVRLTFAFLFSIVISVSNRIPSLLFALFISILLVCFARLDPMVVIRRLMPLLWFLAFIWVALPLTVEGEPVRNLYIQGFSWPGVFLALKITLRAVAVLLVFLALVATMSIITLGNSLNRFHLPAKLVYLLLMTYRYIFVFEAEYRRLRTAIKVRGFRSGSNLHSYKTFAYLIGMLLVRASLRADRVGQAMRCRGFTGRFHCLDEFKPSGNDRFFLVLMTAVVLGLIILEFY